MPPADVIDTGDTSAGGQEFVREGWRTVCYRAAKRSSRGSEAIEQEHPDVALVDIGLPGWDGYEVARRGRAQYGPDHIRLVALIGDGRAEDHAAVREAGFDLHLVKPIDLQQLKDALGAPLQERRHGVRSAASHDADTPQAVTARAQA